MERSLCVNTKNIYTQNTLKTMCLPAYKIQVIEQGESKSDFFYKVFQAVSKSESSSSARYYSRTDTWTGRTRTPLNLGWNMGKGPDPHTPSLWLWLQIGHKTVETVSLWLNTYVLLKGSFLLQFSSVLHHGPLLQGKYKKNSRSWHLARFAPQAPQYLTLCSRGYACVVLPQLLGNLVFD